MNPQIIALIETKSGAAKLEGVRCKLGFRGCFVVPSRGASGGLALLWKEELDLSVQSYSFYHIDFLVTINNTTRFTLFYGSPVVNNRWRSWDLLRRLHVNSDPNLAWCIFGDFNEVLKSSEVWRCTPQKRRGIEQFRKVISDCFLMDIGYYGYKFTFSNKRQGLEEYRSRLDRALANRKWLQDFPDAVVEHIPTYSSDHMALFLKLDRRQRHLTNIFRFERMWLRDASFRDTVNRVWCAGDQAQLTYEEKLLHLQKELTQWNKRQFGNVQQQIKDLKFELGRLKQHERTGENIKEEERLSAAIDEWLHREEILWQQRSRISWLEEGDSNTKFFHAYANSRRKRNSITKLQRLDGTECISSVEIKDEITSYFQQLYAAANQVTRSEFQSRLSCVSRKVSGSHNAILTAPYTASEVAQAVFQLHPSKAPGKDGFSAAFIQSCWSIIKDHFIADCLSFLNHGHLNNQANVTLITLIPKQKEAIKITDYRPISLIGVKEKVLSKVIANRLQQILQEVISDEQCAFVRNRLITDNVLVAQEVSHYIHYIRNQKSVYGSLKLDVAKAYDKVSWPYLFNIMLQLGFDESWARKVMKLVTSVKYSVRINEDYTDYIVPKGGLRQGDPLSPYLFIICTEGLSAMINQYKQCGQIDGIKICRRAPVISHLLFADDSLIFMKITESSIRKVKNLLSDYEYMSGQSINYTKSEAMLSRNASQSLQIYFENTLRVRIVQKHERYLGVPLLLNRQKSQTFQSLVDKVWAKAHGWKNRFLSAGGRHVLVASVLNAIPLYWLSCFLLPDKVTNKIHSIINNFWWQQAGDKRPVHWVRADILRKPKEEGGLDFFNFKWLNKAFLAKQCWRIMNNPQLLVSRILQAKYFHSSSFLDSHVGQHASHVWRSLHSAIPVIQYGSERDFRTGNLIWKASASGNLDIKSCYKIAKLLTNSAGSSGAEQSDQTNIKRFWKQVWKLPLPRKIKLFVWRAYMNGLPTGAQLQKRGFQGNFRCHICHYKFEDDLHPFVGCWWSRSVWSSLGIEVLDVCQNVNSLADLLYRCFRIMRPEVLTRVMVALWFMWYHRNKVFHEGDTLSPITATNRIIRLHNEFCRDTRGIIQCISPVGLSWQKPKAGFVKVNCDASWNEEEKEGGIGVVLRDSDGVVLALSATFLPQANNIIDCEGNALWEGMKLARRMQEEKVILEVDNKEIALATNFGLQVGFWKSAWYTECLRLLAENPNWQVLLVRREANMVADAIARKAYMDKWCWHRLDSLPVFHNIVQLL